MKIHRGDTVKIIVGKDTGKTGKVIKLQPSTAKKSGKVLLEGLNMYKKHVRPKKQGEKGEIVALPRPVNVSNVMIICSSCKRPTRVGYEIKAARRTRICKKCKASI